MRAGLSVLLSLFLFGCSEAEEASSAPEAAHAPRRIVSLDYCADQYVLQFAEREDIVALSPDADKSFSYLRAEASDIAQVRPRSADVLALEPDLVVRSYGGGPQIGSFLERAGVELVQIGYPGTIAEVRGEVIRIGSALGKADEATTLVADMDARLARLKATKNPLPKALYMAEGGVTSGKGSLVHELMVAAGLSNFQDRAGWNPIPLERLVYERPDVVVASFFENEAGSTHSWSAARHTIAQKQLSELPVAKVEGAWTACGGWFLVEAVEAMANTAGAAKADEK
ncbi:ABC transporter substrate-binding protein [Qipengyuania sp. S6317L1]|uniref:ABC transporter substrate-binding protein n=1 Tax=Qipengyuania sp. S6317L1 TaxID=2926410 RepID=UPI001FF5E7F2|nr:ABC transporter substrate-binding protein [Qipengyuania sp. S6317L1]MCK0098420.1 ABC transporter substrate-binding protein [Qipengyuania sp. S6317L1]